VKTWSTPVRAGESGAVPCSCCGSSFFKPILNCEGFGYVRCTACGLVQMNPQPLKDEIIARYSSVFAEDYLRYELDNEAAFLKLQQLAIKDAGFYKLEKVFLLRAKDRPSVLDVGCATGTLLAFLRDRGWRVTGVEISACWEYARNERKLDVRNLPLEENKFPDESFDVILASHLIEHLNDPRSFLVEIFRILKNDGYIFISTPNISGFQARLFGGFWRSAIFDHLYLFSVRTLKTMLKMAGFKVEKVSTWGGLAAGLAPMYIKKTMDFLAKRLGFGDVMIIRARKNTLL
jgi:2-polyprenyl-3-methyl-5-hydroxy-6-metoxy-1,4-benzoquinol methylase